LCDVQSHAEVAIPPDSSVVLLYHGKILDYATELSQVEPLLPEFTVHCFFRSRPSEAKFSPQFREFRGFDRLLSLNYSREQVNLIRENFHRLQGTDSDRFEIEDEWYPALFSADLPPELMLADVELPGAPDRPQGVRSSGSTQVWICFVFGFMLGLYLGVGALIFMLLTFRNKKILLGIALGSCLHCLSNVFRE
jgi:hypothetical protein